MAGPITTRADRFVERLLSQRQSVVAPSKVAPEVETVYQRLLKRVRRKKVK